MRDDNSMWHQQQLEQQEWEMLQGLHKEISALTDKEFFEWIESVDKEKAKCLKL
jgi:rubrerythrin